MAGKQIVSISKAFNKAMPETKWKCVDFNACVSLIGKGDLKASVTTQAARLFVNNYPELLGGLAVSSVTYVKSMDHTIITWGR